MARERNDDQYDRDTGRRDDDRERDDDRDEIRGKGKEPELLAYTVKDRGPRNGKDQDAIWNRIGAAWKHRDGQGYDVALTSNPLDGRISLRENRREEFKEKRRQEQDRTRGRER